MIQLIAVVSGSSKSKAVQLSKLCLKLQNLHLLTSIFSNTPEPRCKVSSSWNYTVDVCCFTEVRIISNCYTNSTHASSVILSPWRHSKILFFGSTSCKPSIKRNRINSSSMVIFFVPNFSNSQNFEASFSL